MADHADMPPSSIERVILCPASWKLEQAYPNASSAYSREGTAAHELAALCLNEERNASFFVGETITVEGEQFVVDAEMAGYVQVYVDFIRRQEGELFVEQRVVVDRFKTWGTGDAVHVHVPRRTLRVTDLKYGVGVPVSAIGNAQLRTYGLGAFEEHSLVAEFDTVEMTIVQPRLDSISTETLSVAELLAWAEETAPILEVARVDPNPALNPGPKQCRFCRAKAGCPAVGKLVVDTTGIAFENLEATPGERLAAVLPRLDMIEDWCKEQRSAAVKLLQDGGEIPGFKLVEGRRGNRAWLDEKTVEEMLGKQFRLSRDEMYEFKVIGPAAAQRLLEKESPRRWKKLQALITQSSGRPTVVPADDKRRAIEPAAPVQFDDLTTEEEPLA